MYTGPPSLALRAAAAPIPLVDALLLPPPPAPPAQGLPPVEVYPARHTAEAEAEAGGDGYYTIQTIGVDGPAGSVPTDASNVIEVTVTQPAAVAAPTGTVEDEAAAAAADDMDMMPPPPPPPPPSEGEEAEEFRPPPPPPTEGSEKGPHNEPTTGGECRLMGPFAIFVQLGLGGLALMSLVFKRWRERPQRPVKIWFFDVSKQVFGSVLVHMANVFMSLLTSGRFNVIMAAPQPDVSTSGADDQPYAPNPCSFYLLNLAIDTTIGIPILIGLLRATTAVVSYTPLGRPYESIQSGNYGRPPNAWWWLKQSIIYFFGLFGMKFVVLIIFLTMPWIAHVGDWALSWTDGNEEVQIVFVMMLFPLIMNGMQYYIIDSFIKGQTTSAAAAAAAAQPEDGGVYDPLADSADDEGSDDDDDDDDDSGDSYIDSSTGNLSGGVATTKTATTTTTTTTTKKGGLTATASPVAGPGDPEYDPAVDGDSPTIIGSTSSQRSRPSSRPATAGAGSIPKERYLSE